MLRKKKRAAFLAGKLVVRVRVAEQGAKQANTITLTYIIYINPLLINK